MSRPWMLGFVYCWLLVGSTSVGVGQEYLDLPDEPETQGTALGDMWSSLKQKLRRSPRQSQTPSSAARQNSSQNFSSQAATQRSTTQRTTQPRTSQTVRNAQSGINSQSRTSTNARPSASDLLPDTKLFSRGSYTPPTALPSQPKQLTPVRSTPQQSRTSVASSPQQVARKSPSTKRANELEAALADLLPATPVAQSELPQAQSQLDETPPPTKVASRPTTKGNPFSGAFDLRKALQDDEEQDSIAAEVTKAIEGSKAEPATKPVVTAESAMIAKPEPNVQTPAKVEPAKPAIVVAAPKEEPAVTKAAEPVVNAPAVVPKTENEPAQQPIIIAKPKGQPTMPLVTNSQVVSDPFEESAKQAFSQAAQPSNPMRPFLPTAEPTLPTQPIVQQERGVLQTTQQPVIVSHVEGPRSILVGREATYQVTLENTSSNAASSVSAEISVPEWAELVDAMSTSGVVERHELGTDTGALEWKLSKLEGRSSQSLRLRLIPRSGRPLQLGVRWSQAPVQSQAVVEVQEPKLEVAISGPQEVRFGKPQRYRLTLRNPGTGLTEQVSLRLVPPGSDPQSATTQVIGDLKPGEARDLDLELTAREAGELLIQADAFSKGGLKAETTKTVLCRKPELEVDWRGPDKKYAGTVAAYYFRVRNPGTTATEPVEVSVKMPSGTEFISASEGYAINPNSGVVSWQLASIDVDEEQFVQLRCKIVRPGSNDFKIAATTTDGELTDSKAFQTEVIALADLKLEVIDPQGPLPLGETAVYEIRVRNRGTTGAENVSIVGLFSEGIEPTTVEGAQYSVRDGRVSFHPIKNLPAGREVQLKIHAKASQVGTHIFRAEVTCPTLDIKLAAEETTRFFEDEHRWEDGQTAYATDGDNAISR